jgi:hypothetical protein
LSYPITAKPSVPFFIPTDTLALNATGIVPICESTGNALEKINGTVPTYSSGTPTHTTGSWGNALLYDLTIGTSTYAGRGMPHNATACSIGCTFNLTAPSPAQLTAGWNYGSVGTCGAGEVDILHVSGSTYVIRVFTGTELVFSSAFVTPGHDTGVVVTWDSITNSSQILVTVYLYDYTSNTTLGPFSQTYTGAGLTIISGSGVSTLILNPTGGGTVGFQGTISNFTAVGGTTTASIWTPTQVAAYFTDPAEPVRRVFTLSPATVSASSSATAISLTDNANALTAGTPGSPVFSISGGTGSSIPSQVVSSTSAATLQVIPGTTGATETITDPAGDGVGILTVSATPATAVTLSGTPSGSAHNPSSPFTASVNGTLSSSGVYTLHSTDPNDVFTVGGVPTTTLTFTTAVQSFTVAINAFVGSVARTISLVYVSGPVITNTTTISYTATISPLAVGTVSTNNITWNSCGVVVPTLTGGSGPYTISVHNVPRAETTPSGATLIATIPNAAAPFTYTAPLVPGQRYLFNVVLSDANADTPSVGTPAAAMGWTIPGERAIHFRCGQSHTGKQLPPATIFNQSATNTFRLSDLNQGYTGTNTNQWTPGTGVIAGGQTLPLIQVAMAALGTALSSGGTLFGGTYDLLICRLEFGVNDVAVPIALGTAASPATTTLANATSIGNIKACMNYVAANLPTQIAGLPIMFCLQLPILPLEGYPSASAYSVLYQDWATQLKAMDNGTTIFTYGDEIQALVANNPAVYGGLPHMTQPGPPDAYAVWQNIEANDLRQALHRRGGFVFPPTPALVGSYFEA